MYLRPAVQGRLVQVNQVAVQQEVQQLSGAVLLLAMALLLLGQVAQLGRDLLVTVHHNSSSSASSNNSRALCSTRHAHALHPCWQSCWRRKSGDD
jgi:hypothetical protein